MEVAERQNVFGQIQDFLEWHPDRKDLYRFVHDPDHRMELIHKKPKEKSDKEEDDSVTSCFLCSSPIEDDHPCYRCTQCKKFLLHKACAELPKEIKHPAHTLHYLTCFADLTSFVPWVSPKGKFISCSGCKIPIQGMAYGCAACRVFFHNTCLGFPDKLLHPKHPSHPLILDYGYLATNPHNTSRSQDRTLKHTGFNYRCDGCDINKGVGSIFPSSATTKAESANEIQAGHLLVLLPEQPAGFQEDDCLACGELILDSEVQPIFQCKECEFSLHHDCVLQKIESMLPAVFQCPQHQHELRLGKSQKHWLIGCDICGEVDPEIGISSRCYQCKSCDFDVHVICMLRQMGYMLAHELADVVLNISPVIVRKLPQTVGDMVKSMKEAEKKRLFEAIVKAATSSTREKPKDPMKCPEYSQELFTQTINDFEAKCLDPESGLICYTMKSKVTKIDSILVSEASAPVFKALKSYLGNSAPNETSEGIRIFVFMVLCAAMYSICSTKENELNETQLYTCWECFKIVEIAGFGADFAFKRLKKALNGYFGLQDTSSSDESFSGLDSDLAKISSNDMKAHIEKCTKRMPLKSETHGTTISHCQPKIKEEIEIVGKFEIRDSWLDYFDPSSSDGNPQSSTDDTEHPDAIEEPSIHREGQQGAKTTKVGADSINYRRLKILGEIKKVIEERCLKKEYAGKLIDPEENIDDPRIHNHKLHLLQENRSNQNSGGSKTSSRSGKLCFACNLPTASERTYYCDQCNVYLHVFCARLRLEIEHPLHGHEHCLVLDHKTAKREEAKCNACGKDCRGSRYCCQKCNFNLEVQCLFREPTEKTKSHGMAVLMDDQTTLNGTQGCFACRKKFSSRPFLRCAACNVSLHMECA